MEKELKRVGVHHSFDADVATELKSLDLAVLIHHLQYWIRHNAKTGKNFHEERTWTYQTLKDIAAHFPYWSHKQVERLMIKLVELEILIKGNFNNSAYDRTVWYAFKNEERFSISRNREMDLPESGNQDPEIGTPIPDSNTYLKKKKKKREILSGIEFDHESQQFINISEDDKSEWLKLYPGVDIDRELIRMRQWLIDPKNPERDGHRTFITRWLDKAFEDAKKKPKKPNAVSPSQENSDNIPYHSAIAASYRDKSEEEYVDYLKRVTDQSHYQNHVKSRGKQ